LHPQSLTPRAALTRSGVIPTAESPAATMSPRPARRAGQRRPPPAKSSSLPQWRQTNPLSFALNSHSARPGRL
jgi:hypothetical protein